MRKPLIVANWKMNMLVEDSVQYGEMLVEKLKEEMVDPKKVDVVVCPPYIHMAALKVIFVLRNIAVGAQNMHYEDKGAFTGEISAAMLQDMGIEYCIIGHSERRQMYNEKDKDCARKVNSAVLHNIHPILCVGESLAERDAGRYKGAVKEMLISSLENVTARQMEKTTIAYEPVWAIGTGKTATAEQAQEMAALIRREIEVKYGKHTSDKVRILYGGSVNTGNIAEIMSQEDIDGALVGGASLDAAEFAKLVNFDPATVGRTLE